MMSVLPPANLMSSTNTDKKIPFSRCKNTYSQLATFSQPYFNRIFSKCLSHNSSAKGWPYRFLSRRTTASSILDHDFGHLCRGRRLQMCGHFDFEIFNHVGASFILTWVQADTASAACPAHFGSLDISFHSNCQRFVSFNNTSVFCPVFPNSAASFLATSARWSLQSIAAGIGFPTFYLHSSWYPWILHHLDQWSKYRSIF